MSEETLLTAARRVVRFARIDEVHGGLYTVDTMAALETLDKMVRKEDERQKHDIQVGITNGDSTGTDNPSS